MAQPPTIATDPLSGETVVKTLGRSRVPLLIGHQDARLLCPFCPGNEDPLEEILAERGPAPESGWLARALTNKYPMLKPAAGRHEVLLGSPRHVERISDLTRGELERLLLLWQERLESCRADPRGLWPVSFLNQGRQAGASQPHLHAQLIGWPREPEAWRERRERLRHADCALCAQLRAVESIEVARTGDMRALLPLTSRTGVVRIAPIDHVPSPRRLIDAGALVHRICFALEATFPAGDLNLLLFAWRPDAAPDAHWHLDIVPRTAGLAGFELSTRIVAATLDPARFAERLQPWLS